ncbi:MAG: hypothetical protein PHQ40_10930, partial [Anaerolineaceae bacterium]|nr:hypothetical protein [Anaerolineaceae bacterium]
PGGTFPWWKAGSRDAAWWNQWFARYRVFALHHADIATQTGAGAIIIGGDWLSPAMPGGRLADGSPSGVPEDAENRWRVLIAEIRSHFTGKVLWAVDYAEEMQSAPAFIESVDTIYLEIYTSLGDSGYTHDTLVTNLEAILDGKVALLQQRFSKPVILAPAYPSANGAAQACVPDPQGEQGACLALNQIEPGYSSSSVVNSNLQEQVDIYNALFAAVNQRSWITGLISRGYFPPVPLQDSSISVHGKPAMDVLWYWFPKLTASK